MWSINSIEASGTTIECERAASVEECMSKIMVCPKMIRAQLSGPQGVALGLT